MSDRWEGLRRLAAQATPGPWRACVGNKIAGRYCSCGQVWSTSADAPVLDVFRGDYMISIKPEAFEANTAYLEAANPSAIADLLAERDALRKRLEIMDGGPEHMDGIYCRDVTIEEQDKLIDQLERELAEARRDSQRLDWYFGSKAKTLAFMATYLRGLTEEWTTDQWRAAIDAAMGTEPAAEARPEGMQ